MSDTAAGPETAPELWQPPWWLLVFAPLIWLLIAALVLDRRGLPTAAVAFVLLAPIGMPAPPILRWVRRRPHLAGVHAGPLAFAATAAFTNLPLWLCTAIAIGTLLLAVTLTTARQLPAD